MHRQSTFSWMFAAIAVLSLGSAQARAWDDEGHMIVADIAWRGLDAAHRRRVIALLSLNPEYPHWIEHVRSGQRNEIAFMRAATWADSIKSSTAYVSDGTRPNGPAAAQNIGYADHLQHRYWHYIDIPISSDDTPGPAPDVPNAETQIRAFRAVLRSDAADDLKSYDLVWLEHLVGDVHQPLHAVSRFSQSLPQGDAGGNLVMLCVQPCHEQLHAFWDTILGTDERPLEARRLAARVASATRDQARILDEHVWIEESVSVAREIVYAAPVGPEAGPYVLDEGYRERARAESQRRVALAGARLAGLIQVDLR
jgi:hypothetical protein